MKIGTNLDCRITTSSLFLVPPSIVRVRTYGGAANVFDSAFRKYTWSHISPCNVPMTIVLLILLDFVLGSCPVLLSWHIDHLESIICLDHVRESVRWATMDTIHLDNTDTSGNV